MHGVVLIRALDELGEGPVHLTALQDVDVGSTLLGQQLGALLIGDKTLKARKLGDKGRIAGRANMEASVEMSSGQSAFSAGARDVQLRKGMLRIESLIIDSDFPGRVNADGRGDVGLEHRRYRTLFLPVQMNTEQGLDSHVPLDCSG